MRFSCINTNVPACSGTLRRKDERSSPWRLQGWRTNLSACRHGANTLRAVPIVLGDPVVYYVNTAKFRHRAGSDFMSNIRPSLPLRWSALPAAKLWDQASRIIRNLVWGGGWWEQKQFHHCIVITVISPPQAEKQYYFTKKEEKTYSTFIEVIQHI